MILAAAVLCLSLEHMVQAIAVAEGFHVPTSLPAKMNNPGSLTRHGRLVQYRSPHAGWEALRQQLHRIVVGRSRVYHLDMTLDAMSRRWAQNAGAWLRNVLVALRARGHPAHSTTPLRVLWRCQT